MILDEDSLCGAIWMGYGESGGERNLQAKCLGRGIMCLALLEALPCLCRTASVGDMESVVTVQLIALSYKVFFNALSCCVCARMPTRVDAMGCVADERERSCTGFCRRRVLNACKLRGV